MAEARGFEPPEPQGFNTLARCRLRPLGHASFYMAEDTGFEPAVP